MSRWTWRRRPGPEDELTAEELAEIRGDAGAAGRAAAFGAGGALDVMPGCPELALFADAAAGADDGYAGVSDDELTGLLRAWDRVEAHAAARKLAAIAEHVRRHPEPGCAPEGPGRVPAGWDEFTADELAWALAESRGRAEDMLTFAVRLAGRLPGTAAALRAGVIGRGKAEIIAWATALLDPAEARAAEALVLGRAGRLTPGGLRAAVARAVIQVAPEKAAETAGGGGEGRAGAAVGRGLRERGADGPGAPAGGGAGGGSADHRVGQAAQGGRARGRHGRAPRPRLPGHAPGQGFPAPPGRRRRGRRRA